MFRSLTSGDESFLWEMLYEAIHVPVGSARPSRLIVKSPGLSKYVEHWGKLEGDFGMKAVFAESQESVGAAWLRLLKGEKRGYGYVDDWTPELSMALKPDHRGKGLGTSLLKAVLALAAVRYPAVSLSVHRDNPAVRLYERFGFGIVFEDEVTLTMKKGF